MRLFHLAFCMLLAIAFTVSVNKRRFENVMTHPARNASPFIPAPIFSPCNGFHSPPLPHPLSANQEAAMTSHVSLPPSLPLASHTFLHSLKQTTTTTSIELLSEEEENAL